MVRPRVYRLYRSYAKLLFPKNALDHLLLKISRDVANAIKHKAPGVVISLYYKNILYVIFKSPSYVFKVDEETRKSIKKIVEDNLKDNITLFLPYVRYREREDALKMYEKLFEI